MTNSCIKWKTVKTVSWILVVTVALVLGSTAQVAARGKAAAAKGKYEVTMVSAEEGILVDGKLSIKGKGGKIKFDLRTDVPGGTVGALIVTVMVNEDEEIDVEFPFEVEAKENEDMNRVKFRAFLTDADALVDLATGDVVKVLDAKVKVMLDETDDGTTDDGIVEDERTVIGVPGFLFAAKPERGNDQDNDSSLDSDNPQGPNVNGSLGRDKDKGKGKKGEGGENR